MPFSSVACSLVATQCTVESNSSSKGVSKPSTSFLTRSNLPGESDCTLCILRHRQPLQAPVPTACPVHRRHQSNRKSDTLRLREEHGEGFQHKVQKVLSHSADAKVPRHLKEIHQFVHFQKGNRKVHQAVEITTHQPNQSSAPRSHRRNVRRKVGAFVRRATSWFENNGLHVRQVRQSLLRIRIGLYLQG